MARVTLQHTGLAIAIVAALTCVAVAPARAQDTAAAEKKEEPTTLAGLTVTAQKREEALQDVPITVTVLDEQLLQDTGVRDIKDLQVLVPGLTVTSTQNEAITTARIRGIGTVGDNVGLESSVGIVIDGVYRPRNSVGFGDLGQLERIEVLKGPQGTVFGKNTSAGVINVITRKPSFTQSAEGEITVGNYGAWGLRGSYNDALGENAAFSIYAAKHARDGWMDVRTGGGPRRETDDYNQDYHTLRGKLLIEPSDTLEIQLTADYTSREENCCTVVNTVMGTSSVVINAMPGGPHLPVVPPPFPAQANAFDRVAYSNRSTEQDIKDKGISAEVNWETPWLGGATLTSITAQRDWQAINGLDYDYSTADVLYRNANADESLSRFETFSQELRLTGATDKVDWMVGMFYADEDLTRNETYRMGPHYEPYVSTLIANLVLGGIGAQLAPAFPPGTPVVNLGNPALFLSEATRKPFGTNFSGLGAHDRYLQNAKSLAFFTNNTWHASDALDLTLGLRYTREEKDLQARFTNPNGSIGCGSMLTNQAAIGAAIAARIPVWGYLPAATQQGILAAAIPQIIGYSCLPWANAQHNGKNINQDMDEKEWSGTIKAAYRWNDNVMTFASAARGHKGGGFNLDRTQSGITPTTSDTSFGAEFVDSYELGAKTTWADGTVLLNATVFSQEYTDFQLNAFLGTSFVVHSIPKVTSRGLDGEFMWQPRGVQGLMLQGGFTYADTKFGRNIPGNDFVTRSPLSTSGAMYKLPGATMPFAPKFSGSASVTYDWDIGSNLIGRFNIGAKYMGEYNTGSDLDVEKHQDAYTLLNARVGIGSSNNRWMLEAWATNLGDAEYVQVGIDGPLQALFPDPGNAFNTYKAFPAAPRMYGVTFRVRY